jgi:hypothetical protein
MFQLPGEDNAEKPDVRRNAAARNIASFDRSSGWNGLERPMTKTIIVTALRLAVSLAIAGPAQAWPGPASGIDCAWNSERTECNALTVALVHKHAAAHPHIRRTEHAGIPLAPARPPDHDEDPLASMHFE